MVSVDERQGFGCHLHECRYELILKEAREHLEVQLVLLSGCMAEYVTSPFLLVCLRLQK